MAEPTWSIGFERLAYEYMQLDCVNGDDVAQLNKIGADGWQVVRWWAVRGDMGRDFACYILMRVKP